MTKKTLEKIKETNEKIYTSVMLLRADYKNAPTEVAKHTIKLKALGYTRALRDIGTLTDTEQRAVFSYITI